MTVLQTKPLDFLNILVQTSLASVAMVTDPESPSSLIGCGSDLYVSAVVASGGQLDAAERDGTLQRDPDGRLLHAVLAVQPGSPGDRTAAEVPFY